MDDRNEVSLSEDRSEDRSLDRRLVGDRLPLQIVIVCTEAGGGIGMNNKIPWHDPEDLAFFKLITTTPMGDQQPNVLIMGYNTWKSIPKGLNGRISVVITRNNLSRHTDSPTLKYRADLHETIREFSRYTIFIVGGQEIYTEYLKNYTPDIIYHSIGYDKVECDRFFPTNLIDYSKYERTLVRIGSKSTTFLYRLKPLKV